MLLAPYTAHLFLVCMTVASMLLQPSRCTICKCSLRLFRVDLGGVASDVSEVLDI